MTHPAVRALLLLALVPWALIAWGWALQLMWMWFLVPLGIPALGLAHAIGIRGLVQIAAYSQISSARREVSAAEAVTHALLIPPLAVGVAWCVKAFM